jgi:lipoprotein-releasing system permease protein
MFNTLAMIVIDKTREIAILRSIGYTRGDITRIFLYQGAFVLAIGLIVGSALAALLTYSLSRLPIRIRGIFASDTFIVHWDPAHYLWAAAVATLVIGIAAYFPARKAARLEPGAVIRESGS